MSASLKKSAFRSEIRTVKGQSKANYLVVRFWDDKNSNWEYTVYAEVIAKDAVRDVGKRFGYKIPGKGTTNPNVRTLWDMIWEEKLSF
jgi:hypothetical protein